MCTFSICGQYPVYLHPEFPSGCTVRRLQWLTAWWLQYPLFTETAGDTLCPQDLRNLTVFDSALTKTMLMSFSIVISSNYKIGTDFKKISSNTLRLDEREPRKCAPRSQRSGWTGVGTQGPWTFLNELIHTRLVIAMLVCCQVSKMFFQKCMGLVAQLCLTVCNHGL